MPFVMDAQREELIVSTFLAELTPVAIYLHGSVLSSRIHDESDIDLALLFRHGAGIDSFALSRLSVDLEVALGLPPHIGILSFDSLLYSAEVVAGGEKIYESDSYYCDFFAMTVLSMYADFNETRRDIFSSYLRDF